MTSVKRVRNKGVHAEKYETFTVLSSLLVRRTKNTKRGTTRKLYPKDISKFIVTEQFVFYSIKWLKNYNNWLPNAELVDVLLCSTLTSGIRRSIPANIIVYNTPTSDMQSTIHKGTNVISQRQWIKLFLKMNYVKICCDRRSGVMLLLVYNNWWWVLPI